MKTTGVDWNPWEPQGVTFRTHLAPHRVYGPGAPRIVQLPAQTRRDIEKNHTNFASRIRQDPLQGGCYGLKCRFYGKCLKPEENTYPSDSSNKKNRHETFITPAKSHENKTPNMFFIPRQLVMAPDPSKPPKSIILIQFAPRGPGCR